MRADARSDVVALGLQNEMLFRIRLFPRARRFLVFSGCYIYIYIYIISVTFGVSAFSFLLFLLYFPDALFTFFLVASKYTITDGKLNTKELKEKE